MNSKQKAKLVKVIKGDCQIGGRYINEAGQTCAIGALCQAAKVKIPDPSNIENDSCILSPALVAMVRGLKRAYGLEKHYLAEIQKINDLGWSPDDRQKIILEYLETIPVVAKKR